MSQLRALLNFVATAMLYFIALQLAVDDNGIVMLILHMRNKRCTKSQSSDDRRTFTPIKYLQISADLAVLWYPFDHP